MTTLAAAFMLFANGMTCSPQGGEMIVTSSVEIAPYTVQGKSVEAVVDELTSREKPYPSRAYGQVGWFDYSWSSKIAVSDSGEISSACVHVSYKIHYPQMADPKMAKCFSKLVAKVEEHERHHLEITDGVMRKELTSMVGLPSSKARKSLARLDAQIDRANHRFHGTKAGGVMGAEEFPSASCGLQMASAQ